MPSKRRVPTNSLREVARLQVPGNGFGKEEVALLHDALGLLDADVAPDERAAGSLGPSTEAAIRVVQARAGLPETGILDELTLERVKLEVQHRLLTRSGFRVGRVQGRLRDLGFALDPAELRERRLGASTERALREFGARHGVDGGGLVTEELEAALNQEALKAKLSTKRQSAKLQKALLRAGRILRLELAIDRDELTAKRLGPSTKAAIRAFQEASGLPVTGEVDPETFTRVTSVAASRAPRRKVVDAPDPSGLETVPRALRLNAVNGAVPKLQRGLAFFGHEIDERELKDARFGRTTRIAVIAFQAEAGLAQTGHADGETLARINARIERAMPEEPPPPRPRVRGTFRDAAWVGRRGVIVELRTRPLRGEGVLLASRPTLGDGFFDLLYDRPVDATALVVVFRDPGGAELARKELLDPSPMAWVNFTEGDQPYRGPSAYELHHAAIVAAAGGVPLVELVETAAQPDVTRIAQAAGLGQEDVMAVLLAHRAAAEYADAQLDPPTVHAFVAQQLPPSLPGDLLASTQEWELIDQLVDRVVSGVAFMEPELQAEALRVAVAENIAPVTVGLRRDAILAALAAKRREYTLDKPILVGNGNLRALLDLSAVTPARFAAVADAFAAHRGLGDDFWADLESRPGDFGGAAAVADLQTTVDVGLVAKSHLPTVTFLKDRIDGGGDPRLSSGRDLATLARADWAELIRENGDAVPEGTDGETPEEKRLTYARTLAAQGERLYPTVAFAAEVGRGSEHLLQRVPDVAALVDEHPALNLRADNIDGFAADNGVDLDPELRSELRVMQRAHRLAPDAASGRALLDQRLHSSAQIVRIGKPELVRRLALSGVDERTALGIHGYAEFQYAQVLQRLADYRQELHRNDPVAVPQQALTEEERAELLGQIPDLEVLFGPLDSCDCPHCESVFSPAAYLTDLLRWLETHPAETGDRSVAAVLAERRPGIGTIKLNCENTETQLPYIDLVCEVLEAAIPGSSGLRDLQTTRPANELRAVPEHQDSAAYEILRTASAPMSSCFDLWQEESRVFLAHLGVPRWRLMQTFRHPSGVPRNLSIAGEYFGLSSHETGLVVTPAETAAEQQAFWFFDTTRDEVGVLEVLDHAHLGYRDLLTLLTVSWITPDGAAQPVALERPADSGALSEQSLINLSPAAFDRIHRFTRLWRHVPWDRWELDLLLRAARAGRGRLDAAALVALRDAAEVAERLDVGAETLACWFGDLPTEGRPDPADPARTAMSLYAAYFQNPAVLNPPDPAFALPLAPGGTLEDHRPTLLAALAVTDAELSALIAHLGNMLDLDHLGRLVRWTTLARALRMGVADLLALARLARPNVPDPFASPAELLSFLDVRDTVLRSGLTVAELDFLLHPRPDAPFAPSDGVVTDFARMLREALRTNPAAGRTGAAAAHVAAALSLSATQAALLLSRLQVEDALTDPLLDERDTDGNYVLELTAANFPALYAAYRRLHKAARVIRAHGIADDAQLAWLLDHSAAFRVLDLTALPVDADPQRPLFPTWLNLVRWLELRRGLAAQGLPTLERLVELGADVNATLEQVRTAAVELTGLPAGLVRVLDGNDRAAYATVALLARMVECREQARRLGVSAATCRSWADRDRNAAPDQSDVAAQVRRAAKAKYEDEAWLRTVTPLQDALRERKRDGLVAFLLEHSLRTEAPTVTVGGVEFANRRYWREPDDLLRYFLVDVEMSAIQPTSRIKHAIGSVQMFVQRCFLNLEKPDVVVTGAERADEVSLDSWRQWRWMRSYRLWEANRKVFLYPENWIEPELRDDKSPFYVELENELMQGEITGERAEIALRHYLEKVDEVAHLQVVGVHHEVDDASPFDTLPPAVDVMHVIGRTRTEPARYFYRRFDLNAGIWSAWERIDLDITGDHVIPVVYNRALHLFWLLFTEKARKGARQPAAQPTDATQEAPEPPTQLEIKLAWSVHTGEGWSPRRVAPHTLIHPWQRPTSSYNLKPRYKSRDNQLWLDLYVSTSLSFNNRKFYDPYSGGRAYFTAHRFDETARPWHSSSFVFDGKVVAMKLKPLRGQYHILDTQGVPSPTAHPTTSYQYVRDLSGEAGAALQPLVGGFEVAPRLPLPDGMHYEHTRLVNNTRVANPNRLAVLESDASVTLLNAARAPFELVHTQQQIKLDTAGYERSPFFYSDMGRAFFVRSDWITVRNGSSSAVRRLRYTFFPFTHAYTGLFLRELNRAGVDGLLNRRIQRFPETYAPSNRVAFSSYAPDPTATVADPTGERDVVDFSRHGATAIYNWETFFHIPFAIACKLSLNHRFEEAMTWFHRVFDPTDTEALSAPQRFWVTKPFFEMSSDEYRRQRIENVLQNIGEHLEEVRAWKNDPFKPHLIARFRPVAYQKAVVMKYLDNLIAWGDQLFRRDTIESINEATLLYVLALELLGRRPESVPRVPAPDRSYDELAAGDGIDPFGNARVDVLMENFTARPTIVIRTPEDAPPLPQLEIQYFGVPGNDKLLRYWTTVETQLFKIRHGMNIEGVVRQLPLFEPPIDPAVLVRAAAAGVDLDSVLDESTVTMTPYRFNTLIGLALQLTAEVQRLGERMLQALERRDSERLTLLQAAQSSELQHAITAVRQGQVNDADTAVEALDKGLEAIDERIDYYGGIPRMNEWEIAGAAGHGLGIASEVAATVLNTVAGGASLGPIVTGGAAGFGGSPVAVLSLGGHNIASSSANFAALFGGLASIMHASAQMLETQGGYTRQDDGNRFQVALARRERAQLEVQREGALIRSAVAQLELDNHLTQVGHVDATGEFLRSKYTNEQLFDWMVAQLSTVYFQAYQLAYDLAKRAEHAFRFELGEDAGPAFVEFGYWDSLKQGLLAGDRLGNDLHRMQAAYLDRNTRDLELTKDVSLATVAPLQLLELKTAGACTVRLPEWLFDLDHPGHYQRRLRSVGLSVPCVVGPYTNVNATLAVTRNGVRLNDDMTGGYGDPLAGGDTRFAASAVPIAAIATSHGRADRGMFEARGEDDRYLPFEGAGAVSEWRIELDPAANQFDTSTVTDVILHFEYSARAGGPALVAGARAALDAALPSSGARLLHLPSEFSGEWHRFLHPAEGADQTLAIDLGLEQLPFTMRRLARTKALSVASADLVLDSAHAGGFDLRLARPGAEFDPDRAVPRDPVFGGLHHLTVGFAPATPLLGQWRLQLKRDSDGDFRSLPADAIAHAYLLVQFTAA